MVTIPIENQRDRQPFAKSQRQKASLKVVETAAESIAWRTDSPSVVSLRKRLIDIVGAFVGISILAMVIVPVAIAIQLDNPGPLFFRQTRYGYRGKPFHIWKFRSMVTDAEAQKHIVKNEAQGLFFKNKQDPRITRVGRFLRRTSLDEVPQFLNVLAGDMSLVGTRPPVFNEVLQYTPYHWQRLNVKPGITGHWQANGRSSVTDFEQVVEMDLSYINNWSLWNDFQLILKTVAVVLGRKNAF